MQSSILTALLLSTLAGLSTTIGSVIALFFRRPGPRFMSLTLGFSGGVMILVSFVELLQEGIDSLGFPTAMLAFFAGMLGMFLIDVLIPHDYLAEHHQRGRHRGGRGRCGREGCRQNAVVDGRLFKTGLMVALGLGIHNFPEGIASFAGSLQDTSLGIAIAVAIAIHNIPEGIAVAAPIYAATGSRSLAFKWSFISGLAEPVGALFAAAILMPFLTEAVLGLVLSAVAGVMVFISLDELVPVSCSYNQEHLSILGVIIGMAVMSLSLWML